MTLAKFTALSIFQALLIAGAVLAFDAFMLPNIVHPIEGAPEHFEQTRNMTAGLAGVIHVIVALIIGGKISSKIFPSDKPTTKTGQKPVSGKTVMFVIVAGLEVLIAGSIYGSTGMQLLGIGVAVGTFVFNAPLMGEKARIDHILEAADERAVAERAAINSHDRQR